jgi:Glycosyl transferases group 1
VPPERVQVIPNWVDLETFSPGPRDGADAPRRTRFLFVGGLVWRKGPDLLLEAYKRAFAGRDDVELIMKDFGADGVYRGGDREAFREHADSGELPLLTLRSDEMTTEEVAELYRYCDVLVHPYRGEGFAMPVLEAMASGLPVITTAGGPTDEFCPPDAGWRIRATRLEIPAEDLLPFSPASTPWVLQPDLDHLIELMRAAAADRAGREVRGRAGRNAAKLLSWDAVAGQYRQRIKLLVQQTPKLGRGELEPFPLTEDASVRVLATPAWRGGDRLATLLGDWGAHTSPTSSACLYLLADPAVAGEPEQIEAHVVAAADRGGLDLDDCADINVLIEPLQAERDARLHLAMTAYVPLHAACAGHVRMARSASNEIIELGTPALERMLATAG